VPWQGHCVYRAIASGGRLQRFRKVGRQTHYFSPPYSLPTPLVSLDGFLPLIITHAHGRSGYLTQMIIKFLWCKSSIMYQSSHHIGGLHHSTIHPKVFTSVVTLSPTAFLLPTQPKNPVSGTVYAAPRSTRWDALYDRDILVHVESFLFSRIHQFALSICHWRECSEGISAHPLPISVRLNFRVVRL